MHIVHTENSCGWGGQEIRILTEMQGMQGRGHRLTLVCPEQAPIYQAAIERQIPVVGVDIRRKNLAALWRMRRCLQGLQPDLINTHSSTDSWLVALANLTLWPAIPVLRTRHVSSPVKNNRASFWLYQRAAQHIAVTGEALKHQLQRDNGFAADSMTSVPTGIALDYFCPQSQATKRQQLGLPAHAIILGILATLRNWKGHAYLLNAVAELLPRYPDMVLLIVGDGPQRRNLETQAKELQIDQAVRFVGNQQNVPDWLNAMDIFCLPSYGDEGVPQGIMQAMACGLPVVSTPVGAITEAVIADQTGLLVAPKDSMALAHALERLLAAPGLRQQMGQAGLERAQQHFGLEIMLNKMERLFLNLTEAR